MFLHFTTLSQLNLNTMDGTQRFNGKKFPHDEGHPD